MKATHFRIDTRKLTWRECWWQTRSPIFILLALFKLLRIPLPMTCVMPFVPRTADLEIAPDSLPASAAARFQELMEALQALGFHSPVFYRYADTRQTQVVHIAALLHETGDMQVRVMHCENRSVQPPRAKTKLVFLSRLLDRTWFFTSDSRPEFRSPPGVRGMRCLNGSPAALLKIHRSELDRQRVANPPIPIPNRATAEQLSDEYEQVHQEFNVARGLYVPLAPEECVQEQAAAAEQLQSGTTLGSDNAAILSEVDRLLVEKPKWSGSLWILGLSILGFIGLGAAQWNVRFVLLLVPILLLHEAGHWLAMRWFGYTNLRMFFIPLFGAAVTGRHFNVAGWKKALVSLAGPAPGIVLATGLAFAANWIDLQGMERALSITILVNGINLLPFLPLDGGWYLNAILFCRHPVLETGFKVFAVVGLLTAHIRTGDGIWLFLGLLLAISVTNTWRLSRVADTLRRENVPSQSPDQRTLPAETAVRIIELLRASTRRARHNRILATEVLDVFERLNARPPGLIATGGLLVAYVAMLAVGFVGLGAATLAQTRSSLNQLDTEALTRQVPINPKIGIGCDEMATWQADGPQPAPTNCHLVSR